MILGSLATITDQVNKLVELLSIASPYARASYVANKVPHVLVCGSMSVVRASCVCVSSRCWPCVCVYEHVLAFSLCPGASFGPQGQ